MASSSSSSKSNSQLMYKYDVFLSFRGEDTRNNFTGHLYHRLNSRGIFTFLDDKRLESGDPLWIELVKAMEESQVAVIIFSKNYATSSWCLDELVKIMECKEANGQLVIPVFYDVEPSHIRKQTESFADAFAGHESEYKDDVEGKQKVQRWRTALTAAANIKGHHIRDKIEADCIGDLVNDILPKLCTTSLSSWTDIVGIDAHLKEINPLLDMTIDDVRRVWIWGIGGIGKTTIAKAIFDIHSSKFNGACFLQVSKENKHEICSLQSILLSKLVGEKESVNDKETGKGLISKRLRSKKVLVVLDNIDHIDQLKYLAGDLGWFGNGSRIIATTRDKRFARKNDAVYPVTTLLEHDAVKLFNQYAFIDEVPKKCFEEMTLEVVRHAQGLPLALEMWGISLHKEDIHVWRSAIDRIKRNSSSEVVDYLKVSYDGLVSEDQKIFLDIACFLRGRKQTEIKEILQCCHVGADYGLSVLINKSLVFISEAVIQMHNLIQEMGKYIVTKQKERGKPSRLWLTEDFEEFSTARIRGAWAIEAIWVQEIQHLNFSENTMNEVQNLRILYINGFQTHDGSNDQYLPSNLRWFDCCKYPWESLPENFDPTKLVHLDLQQSSLKSSLLYSWAKTKTFPVLRRLVLSGCENLWWTPDFTGMPNLEDLGLEECRNLKDVHHSLENSIKLMKLNLRDCKSLETFECVSGKSLEYLDIQGCSSLEKFPKIKGKLKQELMIRVQCSGLSNLPLAMIQHQSSVTELDLSGMKNLAKLQRSIGKLKHLVMLKVSYCSKLGSLPEEIGNLENLEILEARYTLISQPPSSIVRLNRLKILTFAKQKPVVGIEVGVHFVFPQVDGGLHSLEDLDLSYCNLIGLPEGIDSLSSLKKLNLRGNNFKHWPRTMARLGSLQFLNLLDCRSLTQLPELPRQLDTIYADWSNDSICKSLFQNISSFQHDICASGSLSLRVFTNEWENIPRWFHHQGRDKSVSVALPENWYACDNFLGFAVCYSGSLIDTTAQLLCDEGMACITQNLALSNHSEEFPESAVHFFLVPFALLWNTSTAKGKTPNDYRHIMISFSEELKEFGLRLLYKDESKLSALFQMREIMMDQQNTEW